MQSAFYKRDTQQQIQNGIMKTKKIIKQEKSQGNRI